MAYPSLTPFAAKQRLMGKVSEHGLIIVFVTLLIGVVLTPVLLSFVNDPSTVANLSSTQLALWNLIPLFWIIGLIVAVVLTLVVSSRD